ncbi:MAG: HlyD family secretion protein, partial [Candidatus Schmidhempelia sp.]|nr:HlyD family secretion protein [Candidatus Schmidhempelia sp.]
AVPTSKQELSQYNSAPHQLNTPSNSNYYKAIVSLPIQEIIDNGKALALTSGMTLQSTIFLEKRALYQWMFTPIYRINKSISGPIHGSE